MTGGQLKDITQIISMAHFAAGPQSRRSTSDWGADLAEVSLDASLPPAKHPARSNSSSGSANPVQSAPKDLNPDDFPTHWLDAERQHREKLMLGEGVTELLRDRDYSFILGGAQLNYAVPAIGDCWQAAQSAIYRLVRACDVLDQDGIALYTPAVDDQGDRSFSRYTNVTGQQLPKLLSYHLPPQPLNLAKVIDSALEDYYRRKREGRTKPNGEIILALFDGEPEHQHQLVKTLVRATYHVDHTDELGIGLLQIGNNSIAEGFFSLLEEDLKLARARHSIVKFAKIDSLELDSLAAFLQTVAQRQA